MQELLRNPDALIIVVTLVDLHPRTRLCWEGIIIVLLYRCVLLQVRFKENQLFTTTTTTTTTTTDSFYIIRYTYS
jgi:hypothetical protein